MAFHLISAAVLGGLAPPTSPGPLPHEVAAAAAPSRSPLPWMAFMPAANALMPAPPAPERLRSPAGRSEPQADVLPEAPPKKKDRAGVELGCFGEENHCLQAPKNCLQAPSRCLQAPSWSLFQNKLQRGACFWSLELVFGACYSKLHHITRRGACFQNKLQRGACFWSLL